jgi:predicted N-acetyltransferase YhbS
MPDVITIRVAAPSDAPTLCELLEQLGYPATESEIPARLAAMASFPSAAAFVATNGFGEVVGLVTAHLIPSVHDNDPVAWLTTLVVLEDAREAGIGSALVRHVERWAAEKGARRISVTSGIQRRATHAFYEKRDYENTGLRFGKKLVPSSGDAPQSRVGDDAR